MLSPFKLPEGNVQIAFSGGRTSGFMLHEVVKANGGLPDRVQVTFQNTGREMPETLDFVAEVGLRWGVHIVWLEYRPRSELQDWQFDAVVQAFGQDYAARLRHWWVPDERGFTQVSHNSASRDGEPFVALILSRRFLPNQQSRFCTVEMKIRTAKRFLIQLGWKRWTNGVGLRADEPERLANLPRTWTPKGEWVTQEVKGKAKRVWVGEPRAKDRWIVWTPLADAKVSRLVVSAFWRSQSFDLRLPNVKGNCWLGNCDGCFLKSEAHVAAFTRDFPDRGAWWERAERLASIISRAKGMTTGRGAWFSKRYTRAEMRDFMERQGDNFDKLVQIGALCQQDDGECTG